MKARVLTVYCLFFALFAVSAQTGSDKNEALCIEDECLLCYLSLSPDDPYVTALKEHYKLETTSLVGNVTLKNDVEGITLVELSDKIGKIEIDPNKFKGAIPYDIKPTDNQETLVAKFGADEDPLEWVYIKKLNNLTSIIIYLSDPDYKGVENVTFETLEGYAGIDPGICFSKGITEATSEKNLQDDRDPLCLFLIALFDDLDNEFNAFYGKAPEGFNDPATFATEEGGFGWNSYKEFNNRTAADAELERVSNILKNCAVECCVFFTKEVVETNTELPNKVKTIYRTPIQVFTPEFSSKYLTLVVTLTLWHQDWGIMEGYDPATEPKENDTYWIQFSVESVPK